MPSQSKDERGVSRTAGGEPSKDLLAMLAKLGETAAFCAQGRSDLVLPGLWVRGLGEIGVPISAQAAEQLLDLSRVILKADTRTEPVPPRDGVREATIDCDCADCKALGAFVRDPVALQHRFRRWLHQRAHLEQIIIKHRCDVSTRTVKGTSPHILVCTKNYASFQARLARYRADIKVLHKPARM